MLIKYPNSSGKRSVKICEYCNQEFETLDIKILSKGERFCSSKCYNSYRAEHKQDEKARNIIYQKKCKYGLSEEEYLGLFVAQNNKCAICNKSFEDTKAFVDHDHITKKVRGLLCTKCNSILGMAGDSIDILNKAIRYLSEQ